MASISDGAVKIILKLIKNSVITGGEYNSYKKYLKSMLDEGVIKHKPLTKVRFEIRVPNIENLKKYINQKYNVFSLEKYLKLDKNSTRAEVLETTTDDKAKTVNTLSGLYISSQDNIKVVINNNEVILNTPLGVSSFLPISSSLKIDENILVVGVENAECLNYISDIDHLFPKRKKLYIFRNKYMLEWLSKHNNEYLHFGDFDLAGMQIYKNEIVPKLTSYPLGENRSTFFIPKNIEYLLEKGASDLFIKHHKYKKNLLGFSQEIDYLIELIYQYQKTAPQESLFSKKDI